MMEDGNLKTVEGQFLHELEMEFGFTPVVAMAVLRRSKDVLGGQDFQEDPPRIGQMKVLVVASREPAGKPLSQCRIVPVTVTLDAGEEDLEVLREGGTPSRVAPPALLDRVPRDVRNGPPRSDAPINTWRPNIRAVASS